MKLRILVPIFAALAAVPASAQQRVEARASTPAGGTVEFTSLDARVRVTGWGRGEVQVVGRLEREGDRVELRTDGDRVYVQVAGPRRTQRGGGGDLEVRVPARKAVSVRTTSGEVEVSGVQGAVAVNTSSGTVRVGGRPATVEVSTRSGDVAVDVESERVRTQTISGDVRVDGEVRGGVEVQSVSGEVQIPARVGTLRAQAVSGSVTAPSVAGRVEVQTVSGDIRLSSPRLRGEVGTVSGDVFLSGGLDRGGVTTVSTHSGEIEMALSRGTGAEVQFNTYSGDMVLDLDGARLTRSSRREREVLVGRGGARVELRTFSGDVKLTGR
jgi:DUF4097 and DUF4098 domain-containing protein YvlB